MSWIPAAIGAVGSFFGAQDAASAQEHAADQQAATAAAQLDWSKQRSAKFDLVADPLMADMSSQALSTDPTRFFAGEKAQFETGMAKARNDLMMRSAGNTGVAESSLVGLGLEGAKGIGNLMQKDNQRKLAIEQGALAAAQGQAGQAAAGMNNASNSSVNTYGQMATAYGQQAAAGMAAFGQNMNLLGKALSGTSGSDGDSET
jgi:hypothetical protein